LKISGKYIAMPSIENFSARSFINPADPD